VFGVRKIVLSAVLIGATAAAVCNEPSLGRKRRFVSWSSRTNRVWGAQSRSCSLPVLVKQTAEEVASAHGASVILAKNGQPDERV